MNHLFNAWLESFNSFLACSNLSLTVFCCCSDRLYIEPKRINDCNRSLYLVAKFLAIKDPIEKPTK